MTSDEKLNELQRICDEATPEPWEATEILSKTGQIIRQIYCAATKENNIHLSGEWVCEPENQRDQQFIIASREAMPKLIEAVRVMKEALENVKLCYMREHLNFTSGFFNVGDKVYEAIKAVEEILK